MSPFLVLFVVFSYLAWIKWIYNRDRRSLVNSLKHMMNISSANEVNVRALIVTAHPDDECMFFAPAIIRLVELNASVHLLCLSEGNYYNQGAQRRQELLNSCSTLGIPASRVTIINHNPPDVSPQPSVIKFILTFSPNTSDLSEPLVLQVGPVTHKGKSKRNLQDDPKAEWSISLVSSIIMKHMTAHSISMVLTFDERGVSGHANHIAINKAVRHLAYTGEAPEGCVLLRLVTVGLFRKYISFLELPISWLLPSRLCCICDSQGYKQAKAAMMCHHTQLLWFRHLYIIFSRYMFINTFQEIQQGPKNLKIY